jgi:hypothetical protein
MTTLHGPGHEVIHRRTAPRTTWQSDSTIISTSLPDQGSSSAGLPPELKDKEPNAREDIADVVATPNQADGDAFIV